MAVAVGKVETDQLHSSVGVKATLDFIINEQTVLTPQVTAGWLHNWGDDHSSVSSSFVGDTVSFMTRSIKQDRDAALLVAEVDLRVQQGKGWDFAIKASYGLDLRESSRDQSVFAGVEFRF